MSDQTDHTAAAAAPYRHEITISVGGDSEDQIQIKTPPSVTTPTPSPRSIQSTTDEISNSTDDDHAVLAPKQNPSPSGVDNLAFENEHKTSQQRPMSSFGQNGNGKIKEPATNGKNEAVNLELVNLNKTPTTNGHRDNGIPAKKKDATQVEIGNSYNEYFVPVNEHKKYMRGEKLYVTKDKRLKTNWRKRILWVIGLALCAAVLIVAILLATGTIGSEPEPIESRQFGTKDKLATAGIFGSGSKGKQNDTEYPTTPQPPGSTVPPHPPTTDENMIYVPNSADGKFKIENTEFLEEYKDHDSPIYHTIAGEIENGVMESMKDYKNVHVRVLNLTSGSIVVDYRVTWDDDEDITEDTLKDNLSNYLKENSNYIFSYFVPIETLSYTKVIDSCAMQTSEMHCENGCEFDRQSADFVCRKSESESNAEPEPETRAEPEPESSPSSPEPESAPSSSEPEPKSEAEPSPEGEPTAESEPKPEGEPSSEVEPEPATAEPSAKQIEGDIEHVTSEPVSKSEPSAEGEPTADAEPKPEGEPSAESEPTADAEPKPEGEPTVEVEPEPATAEPSSKQVEGDIEHVTSEPISKSEPSAEGEPTADAEPKPEGEPNAEVEAEPATAEPSAKQIEVEATSEPISKSEPTADAEPKPEGEPSAVEPEPTIAEPSPKHSDVEHKSEDIEHVTSEPISKVEPSPDIIAEEDSTAEPSSKKNNKNGKELNYDEEPLSEEKDLSSDLEGTTISLNGHTESTTRKQKYTYDFDATSHSDDTNEKVEISSEQHGHSAAEGSTLRSASEQPAPVTEDLSDDTPLPTENYFKKVTKTVEQRTEVNVMDGTVTPSSINLTSPTVYSTTAPIKLEHETTSAQPTVRLAPTSESPMYSVTENILEQSPFLPENENGDSPLNILTSSHILRGTTHDDEEAKAKTLDIEEESSENDNANFISGPEIIPQKTYKLEGATVVAQNSTTALKEIEASEEKTEIPSDSTEIYHLQESRTHNHDNIKAIENQSEETLEFSHHTEGGAVPTTVIPFSKSDDEDSTEMEEMTESDLLSLQEDKSAGNGIASSSILPVSSSTIESSTERLDETTLVEARHLNKDIEAIPSESEEEQASSTEHLEQLVSSTSESVATSSEKIVEISPSAEPSIPVNDEKETTVLPLESSSAKIDSTTVSVEQTVSTVVGSNETETKISPANEQSDEVSPTAEPSISASESENSTPALTQSESDSSKSADLTKSEISTTTSEKIDVKSSTEPLPMEKSPSPEPVPSETTPSAEPIPSETTTPAAEPSSTEAAKLADDALKVIPLETTRKPDDDKTSEDETKKMNGEETTESTTGHFLLKATFQPINESVETSLNSSLNSFHDSTSIKNEDDENVPVSHVSPVNESSIASTPPSTFGYTRCTAGQFECLNGTSITDGSSCISLSQRCDSNPDCSDSSDEADCEMKHCPGHFQCNDGSCLARSLVCDKIVHCHDGSDESDALCNDWKCKFDEIACGEKGPCLPAILQCDGITHCSNQADETNCPDTCKNNEFFCSWQQKCIPETFVCDGKVDCIGGEDERLCDCPEDHFKCNTGRCVPHHYVCDGQPQCADLSDDWDCFNITTVQRSVGNITNPMMDDIDTAPETNANALQIKKPNGKFAFVCYDNWNLNYADMICKNFGFARSMDYTSVQIDTTNKSLLVINDEFQQGNSMLSNMNETDSCTDDKIVALECEKYTCGNNLTRDKDAGSKNQTWPSLALAVNEISNVRCTATIVSPRHALASYSCILGKFELTSEVEKTLSWYLQVNGSNYDDEHESTELQQVNVARIFKYPQTKSKHFLYSGDVVLLELDAPIEFGESVTAACLSNEPINDDVESCISAGWFSEEGESRRKHYIKNLSATPLSTESCNSTANYAGSLPDDLICMENNDNDEKCQINTDEGAPLLCYSSSRASWQLKGILSYRNDCRRHALPAVYSELTSSLLKWITKTIGNDEMVQ
ncbi:uro-adherence factor A-like isoform X3 [Sitodiplosis mosellana]|uniref:uro-adherence factor A-like isoform X3 n=1 Tax=Sitodiplosis mosellana TaxID=263140 RepID=UPI002445109A|nr:uro-adherence factor A-like isoform X3 [Sitodiplosis mosellana]XP_055326477.1 uro-adherence factor A-like isoform X3 [Sitodiplosis mosellana]